MEWPFDFVVWKQCGRECQVTTNQPRNTRKLIFSIYCQTFQKTNVGHLRRKSISLHMSRICFGFWKECLAKSLRNSVSLLGEVDFLIWGVILFALTWTMVKVFLGWKRSSLAPDLPPVD